MSSNPLKALLSYLSLSALLLAGLAFNSADLSAKPTPKVSKETIAPVQQAADPRLDINLATVEQLMTLKGVGLKRAEAIVKERETNGPFSSIEDLTRVKGIGKKTVENNSAKIMVAPKVEAPATKTVSAPELKAQPMKRSDNKPVAPAIPKGR